MEYEKDAFRKKFPYLYGELKGLNEDDSKKYVRNSRSLDTLSGYEPDAEAYIRRAPTRKEAVEIVGYLLKRGEISQERAASLLRQIKEEGVRSFGSLKTWGHYEKAYRRKTFGKQP